MFLQGVLVLCFDKVPADLDRAQFVSSDSPVENFLSPGIRIEYPTTGDLYDRYGTRPAVVSDTSSTIRLFFGTGVKRDLRTSHLSELHRDLAILDDLAAVNKVITIRSKYFFESRFIECFRSRDKCFRRLLRRGKLFRPPGVRPWACQRAAAPNEQKAQGKNERGGCKFMRRKSASQRCSCVMFVS